VGEDLYRALVDQAFECIMTVRPDYTVGFASPASESLIGYRPDELVGRPAIDFVHPDDQDRAALGMHGWATWGMPGGSSSFRLRHKAGGWRTLDMTASAAIDHDDVLVAVYWRPAGYQHSVDQVLSRLLGGSSRAEALFPLLDVFDWSINDAHVAIAWYEPGAGHQFVSTGLPRELTGAEDEPGAPWRLARETARDVFAADGPPLDPVRRRIADRADRGTFWTHPVPDAGSPFPALITFWNRTDGPPPEAHAQGMALSSTNVELILRWSDQVHQLDRAAHTDALTGLPNRRALFEWLDQDRDGGALLFCDLDRFKPVNDEHGHHVGDEVLRQVADRLAAAVRVEDLVARTGGDEFVVLARGATADRAADLADRIAATLRRPFHVDGVAIQLGISIGTAQAEGPLSQLMLAQADKAMLADKARRHRRRPSSTRR